MNKNITGDKTFVNIAETINLMININPPSSFKEHSKERSSKKHSSKVLFVSPYTELSSLLKSIIKKSEKPSGRFLLSGKIDRKDLTVTNKKNDFDIDYDNYETHKIDSNKISRSIYENGSSVVTNLHNDNDNDKNIDNDDRNDDIWMCKMNKVITQLYIEK